MSNLSVLVYDRSQIYGYRPEAQENFDQEPPIETVIDPEQIKERVMDYLGAVLARCWYDKQLLRDMERNAHTTLRHLGILLPDELEISFEKKDRARPKILIHEWNQERTFKRKVCYLQMIMMAGR